VYPEDAAFATQATLTALYPRTRQKLHLIDSLNTGSACMRRPWQASTD
jgi:hypothetical protein